MKNYHAIAIHWEEEQTVRRTGSAEVPASLVWTTEDSLTRWLTLVISLLKLVQIAGDPVIFKRQRHCDETEIEDEHGHSQDLAHLPTGEEDGEKDKKKHRK